MTAQIATVLGPALDEPGALQQPSTVHVSSGEGFRMPTLRARANRYDRAGIRNPSPHLPFARLWWPLARTLSGEAAKPR